MGDKIKEESEICVFISYSWTNESHEKWVLNLANRLIRDGIQVILDKWDLKEGQDIYNFMEQMVKSDKIDKVLIVCDKGYKEKAEKRKGGVGTETEIITPEIYNNVNQEKFIPIVAEVDCGNNPYIPTYIRTRVYIDLSSSDKFEKGYEKLIRNLYQKPKYQKPNLGTPPHWLLKNN